MAAKKPAARRAKKSAGKIKTPAKQALQRIGEISTEGEFMGIGRGTEGQPDYYVYRGPQSPKRLNHSAALKFAAACKHGGHRDWRVPDRTDGALLYANGRDQAKSGWHWLEPQSALYGASAWVQHFGNGAQYDYHKSYEFEVVLVRRVPI